MNPNPYEILHGDSKALLAEMSENSFDAILTDPPYELTSIQKRFGKEGSAECQFGTDGAFKRAAKGFMGKAWDGTGIQRDPAFWRECYRVLKPGAHILVFGGDRTFHRTMCAIEDARFELRQTIAWHYGSGFPKSLDVSKQIDKMNGAERTEGAREWKGGRRTSNRLGGGSGQENGTTTLTKYDTPATEEAAVWDGWGTALKPSFEPIILARKPIAESSVAKNVLKHGTGALNIDGCRVDGPGAKKWDSPRGGIWKTDTASTGDLIDNELGRWPPNTVFTHSPACSEAECHASCPISELDRQSGHTATLLRDAFVANGHDGIRLQNSDVKHQFSYMDEGGASRFFPCFHFEESDFFPFRYEAKPSKSEKEAGLERIPSKTKNRVNPGGLENEPRFAPIQAKNHHPTVKPVSLLCWLARLICPPDGVILDPFVGSGSTGCAAMREGFRFVGCDMESEYVEIARARVEAERLRGRQLDLLEEAV